MTRPGGRSAPDPVPVLHRVRALLDRFPQGPLPESEVKALRAALEPPPGPRIEDLEDHKRFREQLRMGTIVTIEAAAPFGPEGLRALRAQLPDGAETLLIDAAELDLEPALIRKLAEHLLCQGTTLAEVGIGAWLTPDDADPAHVTALRDMVLLGGTAGETAMKRLERLPSPAPHLRWVFARRIPMLQAKSTTQLAQQSAVAIEALLDTISTDEAATLARALAALSRTPAWFTGHRRFAEALVAAADALAQGGKGFASLVDAVGLWDLLRFTNAAYLGFAPGERERALSGLLGLLRSDEAADAARRAPRSDPDAVWLQRRLAEAWREEPVPPGLALRVAVPAPSTKEDVALHVLVDGLPLIPRMSETDAVLPPEGVLHRKGGLHAGPKPNERHIAVAACSEGCCGALIARITADEERGTVTWEVRHTHRTNRPTETLTFDAAAYASEVARAEADWTWEWPARRAARFVRARMDLDPEALKHWDLGFHWANSWNNEREELRITLNHPADTAFKNDEVWLQFADTTRVPDAVVSDDATARATADRIIARLKASDPKPAAKVCGGSRKNAEALGYPW